MTWKCYFHEGPCRLIKMENGVSLEQHGNSLYVWWEIYDSNNHRYHTFQTKREAIFHYELYVKGERTR